MVRPLRQRGHAHGAAPHPRMGAHLRRARRVRRQVTPQRSGPTPVPSPTIGRTPAMDEPFAFFTEDGDITVVGTHDPDHARAVCRADLTATFGTEDLEASITEQPAKI